MSPMPMTAIAMSTSISVKPLCLADANLTKCSFQALDYANKNRYSFTTKYTKNS
jgi:hypothetical protein